jgi:integrase
MTVSGLQKVVANIGMRQSPLRPILRLSPHQFRHSAGIRWIEAGIPEIIVQKWLGHNDLSMTARYVHVSADSSIKLFNQYLAPAGKA